MTLDTSLFIGIDPSGGRRSFTYAALDHDMKLVVLSGGEMEDIIAFIEPKNQVVLGINSPPNPNTGLSRVDEIRRNLPPLHSAGRSLELRLAEHELRQHGINVAMTPSRKELCSNWVQQGFEFYRQIKNLGYIQFQTDGPSLMWLETQPHATFCTMLEQNPLSRTSVEGRLQRQLALFEQGLDILDPMDYYEEITRYKLLRGILPFEKVYLPEELDAISAAFVAYQMVNHPDRVMKVGDSREGQITIPVAELKPSYS